MNFNGTHSSLILTYCRVTPGFKKKLSTLKLYISLTGAKVSFSLYVRFIGGRLWVEVLYLDVLLRPFSLFIGAFYVRYDNRVKGNAISAQERDFSS